MYSHATATPPGRVGGCLITRYAVQRRLSEGKAGAAFVLLFAASVNAETLTGRVEQVSDGDTVAVLGASNVQHKIRISGIDAPERKQPFGNASRKHLATLVAGQEITVKWENRDRYGRIVGFVIVDGQDVNLAQVKAGMAWF